MNAMRLPGAAAAAIFLLATFLLAPPDARAEGRVALVIANAVYDGQPPLPNTTADSLLVQTTLMQAGFDVVPVANADFNSFNAALAAFMAKAEGADIAMVYYAGHGLQSGGRNWLIPTNAILGRDRELMFQAVPLDNIMQAIGGAKVRIVVLDACRNNPFVRMQRTVTVNRDVTTGLGKIEAPRGSMVMYSAAEGQTASDGPANGNSPFAVAFANRVLEPGVDIRLLAGKIADDVFASTQEDQLPFYNTSLGGNSLYLVAPQPSAIELESRSFNDASAFAKTNNCAPMREHIQRYPAGVLAAAAQVVVAACAQSAATVPAATPARRLPLNYLDRLIARNIAPLTDADYAAAAQRLGVEPEVIKAVVLTESGPQQTGFAADGRMLVLFEPHIFSRLTNRRYDVSHPTVSWPSWDPSKYPRNQEGRWLQLKEAFALDQQAALSATQFGIVGLMAMNYRQLGFQTVSDYVDDASDSNIRQLAAFEAFVTANRLVDELQRKDWEGFARVYNGAGQVERYGRLIRSAYERVKGLPSGATAPFTSNDLPGSVQIPTLGETRGAPSPASWALALLGLFVAAWRILARRRMRLA